MKGRDVQNEGERAKRGVQNVRGGLDEAAVMWDEWKACDIDGIVGWEINGRARLGSCVVGQCHNWGGWMDGLMVVMDERLWWGADSLSRRISPIL
jgi:hypothetical protein